MWNEAVKIAIIGLSGVFAGLGALVVALEIFGMIARKFTSKKEVK